MRISQAKRDSEVATWLGTFCKLNHLRRPVFPLDKRDDLVFIVFRTSIVDWNEIESFILRDFLHLIVLTCIEQEDFVAPACHCQASHDYYLARVQWGSDYAGSRCELWCGIELVEELPLLLKLIFKAWYNPQLFNWTSRCMAVSLTTKNVDAVCKITAATTWPCDNQLRYLYPSILL